MWDILMGIGVFMVIALIGWWLHRLIRDRQADRDHHSETDGGFY